MINDTSLISLLTSLNALAAGLFLLCMFGMVATRQVQGCLRLFIAQSLFLACSAFLLSALLHSWHVFAVGVINVISKPLLIPWLLKRNIRDEIYSRREIDQIINIPTSLLIALVLAISAGFLALPLLEFAGNPYIRVNLSIGLAGLLVGAFTASARREAVPMLLGLLAMENSAFFAGIAIVPELPLFAELAIAFDVLMLSFIVGLLTRTIHEHIGTTEVGMLTTLKEESKP
jgi:hydrogenase-4 component E